MVSGVQGGTGAGTSKNIMTLLQDGEVAEQPDTAAEPEDDRTTRDRAASCVIAAAARFQTVGGPKDGQPAEGQGDRRSARRASAVYRGTEAALAKRSAQYLSFLLDPYLLDTFWSESPPRTL